MGTEVISPRSPHKNMDLLHPNLQRFIAEAPSTLRFWVKIHNRFGITGRIFDQIEMALNMNPFLSEGIVSIFIHEKSTCDLRDLALMLSRIKGFRFGITKLTARINLFLPLKLTSLQTMELLHTYDDTDEVLSPIILVTDSDIEQSSEKELCSRVKAILTRFEENAMTTKVMLFLQDSPDDLGRFITIFKNLSVQEVNGNSPEMWLQVAFQPKLSCESTSRLYEILLHNLLCYSDSIRNSPSMPCGYLSVIHFFLNLSRTGYEFPKHFSEETINGNHCMFAHRNNVVFHNDGQANTCCYCTNHRFHNCKIRSKCNQCDNALGCRGCCQATAEQRCEILNFSRYLAAHSIENDLIDRIYVKSHSTVNVLKTMSDYMTK